MNEGVAARVLRAAERGAVELHSRELRLVVAYLELLAHWNRTINLTSVHLENFPDSSLDRLLVEAFLAARFVPLASQGWCDLGSGGGSPAIPLKILRPLARLTMVESKGRKAAFLREAVRRLQLPDAQVAETRFEAFAQQRPDSADLLSVRAVRRDEAFNATVVTLLRSGGRLLSFGGSSPGVRTCLTLVERCELPSGDFLEVFDKR